MRNIKVTVIKKVLIAVLISSCLGLVGCATNAKSEQMIPVPKHTKDKPSNKTFLDGITVKQVTGGKETNPLWTSQVNNGEFRVALEKSLQLNQLYSSATKPRYELDVNLDKLYQPLFGVNIKVTSEIHYILTDTSADKIIYDKKLTNNYTAAFNEAFSGIARLRKANEGAIRENISNFIDNLYKLPKKVSKGNEGSF